MTTIQKFNNRVWTKLLLVAMMLLNICAAGDLVMASLVRGKKYMKVKGRILMESDGEIRFLAWREWQYAKCSNYKSLFADKRYATSLMLIQKIQLKFYSEYDAKAILVGTVASPNKSDRNTIIEFKGLQADMWNADNGMNTVVEKLGLYKLQGKVTRRVKRNKYQDNNVIYAGFRYGGGNIFPTFCFVEDSLNRAFTLSGLKKLSETDDKEYHREAHAITHEWGKDEKEEKLTRSNVYHLLRSGLGKKNMIIYERPKHVADPTFFICQLKKMGKLDKNNEKIFTKYEDLTDTAEDDARRRRRLIMQRLVRAELS